MTDVDWSRFAEYGGYGIGLLGVVALAAIVGFPGTPYVTAMALMVLALAPVMLGFYELGGRTPLALARAALATGLLAVAAWCFVMTAVALGVATLDESRGASGALAVLAGGFVLIGLWLVGACALAGQWLRPAARLLGAVVGVGWVLAGIGLFLGGAEHPLTIAGGIGYQLLFPVWGFIVARSFTVHAGRLMPGGAERIDARGGR